MRRITLTQAGYDTPQSFITKGKQRLKQHINTVYLNNGDEFEIELYNPTTNKVLAKIEINGNSIGSGIVLRPGERVFLERYLDVAKKFLFETYKVSGDNTEIQRAIADNGGIVVRFYNEQVTTIYPSYSLNGTVTVTNLGSGTFYPSTFTSTAGNGVSTFTSGTSLPTFGGSSSTTFTNSSATFANLNIPKRKELKSSLRSATDRKKSILSTQSFAVPDEIEIETGRIEKGSNSDQSFTYDTTTFYSYASYTNIWKILPLSQKPVVAEDLVVYCTECGSKRKKDTHKFCPQCGTKF